MGEAIRVMLSCCQQIGCSDHFRGRLYVDAQHLIKSTLHRSLGHTQNRVTPESTGTLLFATTGMGLQRSPSPPLNSSVFLAVKLRKYYAWLRRVAVCPAEARSAADRA